MVFVMHEVLALADCSQGDNHEHMCCAHVC